MFNSGLESPRAGASFEHLYIFSGISIQIIASLTPPQLSPSLRRLALTQALVHALALMIPNTALIFSSQLSLYRMFTRLEPKSIPFLVSMG